METNEYERVKGIGGRFIIGYCSNQGVRWKLNERGRKGRGEKQFEYI